MRTMKLLTVLGLILAVSGTASAITFAGGYSGPIQMKLVNRDMGVNYGLGQTANTATDVSDLTVQSGVRPGALPIPADFFAATIGPHLAYQEDGWFIFRITSILTDDRTPTPIWAEDFAGNSHGKELVGIGYGLQDTGVVTVTPTDLTIYSENLHIRIWEQDSGTLNAAWTTDAAYTGFAQGSAGRTGIASYNGMGGIGINGNPATVLVDAFGIPGLDPITALFPLSYTQVYNIDGAGAFTHVYMDAYAGQLGDGNIGNGELVSTLFEDPITDANFDWADLWIQTVTNTYSLKDGIDDWDYDSEDPARGTYAIPEPLTMIALFGGITGLAGYIRKRRMA